MTFDRNMQLRAAAAGNLTATEGAAAGKDMGVDLVAQTYGLHVPAINAGADTLIVKIQESDDNATWRDFLTFETVTGTGAPGQYFVTGKSNARYRRYVATVTGVTPNFGAVIIGPVSGGRHKKW